MAKFVDTVPRLEGRTFLVTAYDGPNSAETRQSALDGHLDYVEKHCDRYLVCGPIRKPDDSGLMGSFFLIEAEDAADARAFLDGDPYMASGMYETVTVHEVTAAGGRFMGGVIWESADAVRHKAS